MSKDNLENGWLGNENERGTAPTERRVGTCDECGETIYEDEEEYTYGFGENGELLCWDCYCLVKNKKVSNYERDTACL